MNDASFQIGKPPVFVRDGAVFTDSRDVALVFGKRHDHVLRDIKALIENAPTTAPNFGASSYTDSTGRTLPAYEMTRDGFTLLAMGFTGKKALAWKVKYIDAFNRMEAELLNRTGPAAGYPIPKTLSEALRLAADLSEQVEEQKALIAVQSVKVDAYDRVASCDDLFGLRATAMLLDVPEKKFVQIAISMNWIYRGKSRSLLPYAGPKRKGYVDTALVEYPKNDGEVGYRDVLKFTAKGVLELARRLNKTITQGDLFAARDLFSQQDGAGR